MAVAKTLAYYELAKIAALNSFRIQGTEAVFLLCATLLWTSCEQPRPI